MTAFSSSQLPTGTRAITTLEQLILWAAYILRLFAGQKTFLRAYGEPEEPIIRVSRIESATGDPLVQIVLIAPESTITGAELADWLTIEQIATTAIPASYSG